MIRILIAGALLASPAAAFAQGACATPERGQFDFWVGRWQVTPTAQNRVVAESLIERLYDGCAIRENWMPKKGGGGGSLSAYVPADPGWRQAWVGKDGEWVEFRGGWTGQAMVLTGDWPDGRPRTVRMTYTSGADGSVRQLGEESRDGGRTWGPSFDFTYRRAR
ncbi:hypothetical protein [Phenylobacterium sp.]|uniref:hypothetical protein n=1 Tax=Phenylobacterium sp. TaxID=1871053 RepID=UPI002B7A8D6F|nr:hypothetical protein [Phenylobacterium sp.]HVI31664.1 hypothetical protein [Phenylobacterium sp.]